MSPARRAVALYPNPHKPAARKLLPALVRYLEAQGWDALGFPGHERILPRGVETCSVPQLARRATFVLVLGGDGTFLSAARAMCRHRLPLLGMRVGHIGFLTTLEPTDFRRSLGDVLKGRYHLDSRTMVEARVLARNGRVVAQGVALNDITVRQVDYVKVVKLRLALDKERLGDFRSDGVVVCTPTGATAYSLSAGGPVVMPGARVLVATLICPHTLSSRPVAFSPQQTLFIDIDSEESGLHLVLDGQESLPLVKGQRLAVTGSRHVTRVLRPPGFSYPELLRAKLGWKS
jgi:NAD+ kinase